jgi:hypothetical protein
MQIGPDGSPVSGITVFVGPPLKGPQPVPVTTSTTIISPIRRGTVPASPELGSSESTDTNGPNTVTVDIPSIAVSDEGNQITNQVTSLNFVGSSVLAVNRLRGSVTISVAASVVVPTDLAQPIVMGNTTGPYVSVPQNPADPGAPIEITNPRGKIEIGDPDTCAGISIPPCGSSDPTKITGPTGGVEIGSPSTGAGIDVPAAGSNDPTKITGPGGGVEIGNPGLGAGIDVPPAGSNDPIEITNPTGGVEIGNPGLGAGIDVPPAGSNDPIEITNPSGGVEIGNPSTGAGVDVPAAGSNDPTKITGPSGGVEIGNPSTGAGVDVPAAGSNDPTKITGPSGGVEIGNPSTGAGVDVPPAGSNDPTKITGPSGGVEIGNPSTGAGISVPPANGTEPVEITNPTGPINIGTPGGPGIRIPSPNSDDPITIGDPDTPSIVVPKDPTEPVQIGRPGQPVDVVTGLDKWELIYTGDDDKLDSSPFLKVTEDSDDTAGKSLHLHAALYSTGGANNKLQSAIYFVDDVASPNRGGYTAETTDSKRAASLRFVKQSFGQGFILSPWDNYNDTAFHNKGGVSVWRTTYGGNPATKVTLNDDGVGQSIHGLYLGSGAISFFQDLAGGESPDTDGLAYIVLPGIPDGSGVNKVGQIFANPYRNRSEDGNSGVPYFGLGWKQSTQLVESGGGQSGIEAAERVPGNEVLTWHSTNRVGIMNNDPNFALSVTGDVAFTNTLRVGSAENAGTNGQVLTSTGANTAPIWQNISADVNTTYTQSAESTTGGAFIRLTGSDSSTDDIKLSSGTGITISRTDANTISIQNNIVDTLFDAGTLSGAIALNRNNGTIQKVTLNGNATSLAISNMTTAQSFTIIFTQDGSGSRTLTTSSAFKFASGFKTLSTAAGAVDMLNIFFDGSTYYCTLTTGYA